MVIDVMWSFVRFVVVSVGFMRIDCFCVFIVCGFVSRWVRFFL